MARLPNADQAIVDDHKVTDYLLSLEHPSGRAKARYFQQFGFRVDAWSRLQAALLEHARGNSITQEQATPFGMKYVVDGSLTTPDDRNPMIRTVWIVETGQRRPRFVTAYPLRGNQHDSGV